MATNFWKADKVQFLLNKLAFKGGAEINYLSADPTSVATDAPIDSIGIFGKKIYIKRDAGSTTNWRDSSLDIGAMSTTLINGGELTIGVPNTTVTVADGNGVIVDNHTDPNNPTIEFVSWTGLTNVPLTFLATSSASYFAIETLGVLKQAADHFTNSEHRDIIKLGFAIHTGNTIIESMATSVHYSLSPANQFEDLVDILGPINADGNVYSANGANLNINKSVGKAFALGANYATSKKDPNSTTQAAGTALTFIRTYDDGAGGWNYVSSALIDPNNYDDLSGGLQPVQANKWTIQREYLDPRTGTTVIAYGQAVYNNISDAEAGIFAEIFEENDELVDVMLRGWLLVKQGTAALNLATQAKFIEADKFGTSTAGGSTSSTTTRQRAYENSINGEITLDATHGAVKTIDNVVPIVGNLREVTDTTGAIKYQEVSSERTQITDNDGTHISRKESEVRWIENFKVVAPTTEYTESGGTTTGIIADDIVDQLDGYRSAKVTTVAGNQGTRYTSTAKTNLKSIDFQTQGFLFDWQYDQLQGDWNLVIEESTDGITYTENARLQLPKQEVSEPATLIFKLNSVAIITHYRHYFEQVGETVGAIARWDNVKVVSRPFNYKEVIEVQTYDIRQAQSSMTDRTGEARFNLATATIDNIGSTLVEAVDDATGLRTKFIARGKCSVKINAVGTTSNISGLIHLYKNGVYYTKGNKAYAISATIAVGSILDLDIGEYFSIAPIGDFANDSNIANLSFEATAVQSQAVFKGLDTDLDANEFIPEITGFGTPTNVNFTKQKVGNSWRVKGSFRSGTSTAVEGKLSIPYGHTVLSSETLGISGIFYKGNIVTNTNGGAILTTGDDAFINFGNPNVFGGDNVDAIVVQNGVVVAVSGWDVHIDFTVPVNELKADQPMIAFPVTNDVENHFFIDFDLNGVPQDDISSAIVSTTHPAAGTYTATLNSGLFPIDPKVGGTINVASDAGIGVSIAAGVITIETNNSGVKTNRPFTLYLSRKGLDYKHPQGGFLGNMQRNLVGYIDVDAASYRINYVATTSYKTVPLVSTSGDLGLFGSISSNQLTLEAGRYEIEFGVGTNGNTGWVDALIYNISDAVNEQENLKVAYNTSTISVTFNTAYMDITITDQKILEFKTKATNAIGDEYSSRIKITKLR